MELVFYFLSGCDYGQVVIILVLSSVQFGEEWGRVEVSSLYVVVDCLEFVEVVDYCVYVVFFCLWWLILFVVLIWLCLMVVVFLVYLCRIGLICCLIWFFSQQVRVMGLFLMCVRNVVRFVISDFLLVRKKFVIVFLIFFGFFVYLVLSMVVCLVIYLVCLELVWLVLLLLWEMFQLVVMWYFGCG